MRQRPLATVCIGVTALLAALFFPADYTTAASGGAGGPPAPSPSSPTGGLPTADTQAPTVPAGLTTTPINSNQVDLAWSASTDDVGVTAYKVYRSGALLATLGNVTSYSNSGLTGLTTYSYTVSACDAAGNCSASSAPVSVATQAQTIPAIRVAPTLTGTPTGPITDQTITVSVTPPANVLNLTASLFVAAVLPPSLDGAIYVMSSDRGWTAYTECSAAPTAQVGPLSSGLQISLLPSPTDLSPLRGTVIYVGYGFGTSAGAACTDMLDSSTIAPAYTIN